MAADPKLAELERIVRKQDALLQMLLKKVSFLERENARRKVDIVKVEHARSN